MSAAAEQRRQARYWRKTRVLTAALLCVWLVSSFGVIAFARELSGVHFFGWPLSFYMGAQGSLIVFLLIIGCYCVVMNRLDREAYNARSGSLERDTMERR